MVGFLEGNWRLRFLKVRITEVTFIADFITNIICFSETANLFDRNFTVKGVLILKKGNNLEEY